MIITCEQCGTKFHLDESLITRDAVKVRCSHCRHIFTVSGHERRKRLRAEHAQAQESAAAAEGDTPAKPLPESGSGPEPATPEESEHPLQEASPQGPSTPEDSGPLPVEADAGKPRKAGRAVMVSILSGCLLGLLLALLALWYFEGKKSGPPGRPMPERPDYSLAPPLPRAAPRELRNLVVVLQDARYQGLVNVKGGQLLVIQGEVKNLTGEPRGPVSLKTTLTDSWNQPVQELVFYSGTAMTDEELLQTDPEEIKRWLATPGGREGARVLKPGASQPFTAVLFGVPDNLAEARFGFNIAVYDGPRVPAE